MTINTVSGTPIDETSILKYLKNLINCFFKILPMKENKEPTLLEYIKGFQRELIGCNGLFPEFKEDGRLLTLINILQYMIDNPDCDTRDVRRDVFNAISICNKLHDYYSARIAESNCEVNA